MATIQDVVEMAEMLNVAAIFINEDRCSAVRNRNSKCRKCMDACVCGAIVIENNEVKLDSHACVNCGACVGACPAGVFTAADPSSGKLVAAALEAGTSLAHAAAQNGEGTSARPQICIACERKAARNEANTALYAKVPCLGHVTEHLLVALAACAHAAAGDGEGSFGFAVNSAPESAPSPAAPDITLVDGNCQTCKFGYVSAYVDAAIAGAEALLEAAGTPAAITRTQDFPPAACANAHSYEKVRGQSRRGLLFQTGNYMKNVASNVAEKTINDTLGAPKKKPLKSRLGVGNGARMPSFEPAENYEILDAISKIATADLSGEGPSNPAAQPFESRIFGQVEFDAEQCSGCGLCVLFCPTKALGYAEFDQPENDEMRYLEFRAADCTQCGLCEDVCLRNACFVGTQVTLVQLFDFEPQLIEIPKPQKTTSFLGR